jgi:hypothetical protein
MNTPAVCWNAVSSIECTASRERGKKEKKTVKKINKRAIVCTPRKA